VRPISASLLPQTFTIVLFKPSPGLSSCLITHNTPKPSRCQANSLDFAYLCGIVDHHDQAAKRKLDRHHDAIDCSVYCWCCDDCMLKIMKDIMEICAKCFTHMSGPVAAARVLWGDCGCKPISSKITVREGLGWACYCMAWLLLIGALVTIAAALVT